MAHKNWCGKPCGECDSPCKLDEQMFCSPDCEALNEDGIREVEVCFENGCDALMKCEPGVCPNCGSKELKYNEYEIVDESCIYKWECATCGVIGKECYDLVFSEHIID